MQERDRDRCVYAQKFHRMVHGLRDKNGCSRIIIAYAQSNVSGDYFNRFQNDVDSCGHDRLLNTDAGSGMGAAAIN